ncbi:hypothetical protein AD428_20760 [Achromobacter sp. DMS1]|uniref:hypothetical protein n=1 Tax=Achromobacter sp. DMS1 TaxID=1688405 RepID=UPI0006C27A9A|nr:hypothetical protein [Achromobacter sp. DMS1]KOF52355.1 hypothetical protein AD428_20760 [Achromobacter sp. DMS1]
MSGTSPDPHSSLPASSSAQDGARIDEQTRRLQEENQALRELLAAQVQAQLPPARAPHPFKRLGWWLISAPGAAAARWLRTLRRETPPITGRKLGCATVTVLYTLAIYGALVLLVVYWSTPNVSRVAMPAAHPVPLPLQALPALQAESLPPPPAPEAAGEEAPPTPPPSERPARKGRPRPCRTARPRRQARRHAASPAPRRAQNAGGGSFPCRTAVTLRITEIPAQTRGPGCGELHQALDACAERGFFERPECAWKARERYCAPHRAWGAVKECPDRP